MNKKKGKASQRLDSTQSQEVCLEVLGLSLVVNIKETCYYIFKPLSQ